MFSPASVDRFRYVDYSLNAETGEAKLHYAFDDTHFFTETFLFPTSGALSDGRAAAVNRLLRLLWLAAGISYYKAAVPALCHIEQPIQGAEVTWLKELCFEGLGEFAYVNHLSLKDKPEYQYEVAADDAVSVTLARRSIVAVGGGKDSCVSIEAVRSLGDPVVLAAIGTPRPIVDVVDESGLPSLTIRRSLSPELFALNGQGALNGHVPVTAVVSLALLITAVLNDCDTVVMSNERSASVGNLQWDGREVNHQWSKSLDAERSLSAVVAQAVGPDLRYFSLLRPLSELDIARRFAKLEKYHSVFTSCNRAFHIDESIRIDRWCTNCAKCRFVFLILAPFMTPERLTAIFGKNMLDDPSQEVGFDALIGWNADKPFECVGEVEESIAAIGLLLDSPLWQNHHIVSRFAQEVAPNVVIPSGLVERFLAPSDEHDVPPEFLKALDATV